MPRARPLLRTVLVLALAGGLASSSSCRVKSGTHDEPPDDGRDGGTTLVVRVLPMPPPLPPSLVPHGVPRR